MFFQSMTPIYLNSKIMEKLQLSQWLISATLLKFSHLRGLKGASVYGRKIQVWAVAEGPLGYPPASSTLPSCSFVSVTKCHGS
jgi:hypothetical protein